MLRSAIILSLVAGVLGTGLGGMIGVMLGKTSRKLTSRMFNFAAGVMLGIVFFDLLPHAVAAAPLAVVVSGVLAGSVFIFFISTAVDKKLSLYKNVNRPLKTNFKVKELKPSAMITTGIVMLFSITLHNLPEGLVIGTSTFVSTGLLTTILIGMHNIPEGMAIALPLIEGGQSKTRAVLLCLLSGLPTVLGAVIGIVLGNISQLVISFCLALASGAMICVVFSEMIPAAHEICGERDKIGTALLIFGSALGLILVNTL